MKVEGRQCDYCKNSTIMDYRISTCPRCKRDCCDLHLIGFGIRITNHGSHYKKEFEMYQAFDLMCDQCWNTIIKKKEKKQIEEILGVIWEEMKTKFKQAQEKIQQL